MRFSDAAGLTVKSRLGYWSSEAALLSRIVFSRPFNDCLRAWHPDLQRYQALPGNEPGLKLSLRGVHGSIAIGIAEHALGAAALAVRDAESDLPKLGMLLAQSAYAQWLASLPVAPRSWIGALDLQIIDAAPVEDRWPPPGWPSWVICRLNAAPVRMAAWDIDIGLADAVMQGLRRHHPVSRASSDPCVPARISLQSFRMSVVTIGSLQPGDVLVNPVISQSAGRRGWLVIEHDTLVRMRARAELASEGIMITGGLEMADESTDTEMATSNLYPAQKATLDVTHEAGIPLSPELAQIDLPVHIELGRCQLRLSELASIEPGYIIDTRVDLTDPKVKILVSGQPFAYGRLVALGECFGVCIESLLHQTGMDHARNN